MMVLFSFHRVRLNDSDWSVESEQSRRLALVSDAGMQSFQHMKQSQKVVQLSLWTMMPVT